MGSPGLGGRPPHRRADRNGFRFAGTHRFWTADHKPASAIASHQVGWM